MRLPADQVKAAILHPDRDVRAAAVYYFAGSYSLDPAIMPLAIQVIDQLGAEQAFQTYSFMRDLAQTDETVSWLVGQMKRSAKCTTEREQFYFDAIRSAVIHADIAVLQQHESEILALKELDTDEREAIEERIWFRSRPPEELWSDLRGFCQMCDEEQEEVSPEKLELAYHLVEALARHPNFSVPKVLPILNLETGDAGEWIELFAVRLAGELKLQEAIPQIVDLLNDPDDWIGEECHRALAKIGGDLVVTELARQYPEGEFDLRSSAANIFEEIHTDLSVETCLSLFETESDHDIRCSLLQSVLMNFCADGIEPARQLILTTPIDIEVLEVRCDLLTACKLLGKRFPEFDAWQEDSKNDREFRRNWYKKLHHLDDDFDWDEDLEDEEEFEDELEEDLDESLLPPTTIVRHEGRIGRNDPCPCGSGKKYKNCCLRNQQADAETDLGHASAIGGTARKKAQYPIGTVAFYGPDDTATTKIVAGVIRKDGAEPILERWVGTNLRQNPKVQRQIQQFFDRNGVKSVALTEGNLGCPHEEGEDFPVGEDCPFCPFWAGKQGSNRQE